MPPDSWNPDLYRRFETQRTQPARDLLARVVLERPRLVVDLGCGPGNSTELLARRFPDATVLGVDSSEAMLASARKRLPAVRFEQGDIADWAPPSAPDLVYANAALHWVADHATLVPRLFGLLAPGGVLAVQVPDNRGEPSHRTMREVASDERWASALAGAADRVGVLSTAAYYDLLVQQGGEAEVWRTVYCHPMDTPGAIVDWVKSTGLQPYLALLSDEQRPEFLQRYEAGVAASYPAQADGKRLLMFPRLFFVATKR